MFKREKHLLRKLKDVFRVLDEIERHYRLIDPRTPEDVDRIATATENRLRGLVSGGFLSFMPGFEIVTKRPEANTGKRTITMPIVASIKIDEMELMMAVLGWKDPKI